MILRCGLEKRHFEKSMQSALMKFVEACDATVQIVSYF